MLAAERAASKTPDKPRRAPRPLRVQQLVEALDRRAVDVNDPRLPAHLQPRFRRMVERLAGRPWRLDTIRAAWAEAGTQRPHDGWSKALRVWVETQMLRAEARPRRPTRRVRITWRSRAPAAAGDDGGNSVPSGGTP